MGVTEWGQNDVLAADNNQGDGSIMQVGCIYILMVEQTNKMEGNNTE